MIARGSIEWLRGLDKRWQRLRDADKRRVLVDSRTAMNYATMATIVEGLQKDPRIEVFLTASETPELLEKIYADARQPYQLVRPKTAAFMQFDAYLAADFLWARLPRGTR